MDKKHFPNIESKQAIRDEEPPRKNNNNKRNQYHPFGDARIPRNKYRTNIAQATEPKKSSAYADTGATQKLFHIKLVFM